MLRAAPDKRRFGLPTIRTIRGRPATNQTRAGTEGSDDDELGHDAGENDFCAAASSRRSP